MPPALVVLADATSDDMGAAMDVARRVGGVGRVLLFRPAEAESELARKSLGFRLWPQQGETDGQRFARAFEQARDLGYEGAVVVAPGGHGIGADRVTAAVTALEEHPGVIAADGDGGIALLGLQEPHPTLFKGDAMPDYAEMVNRAGQQRVRLVEVEVPAGSSS